jgi:hypothetical protein
MVDRESKRIVEQRIRNNVIGYLELAGSFERQIEYSWRVPIAYVPYEVINQWEDSVDLDSTVDADIPTVYSLQEVAAMRSFHRVWQEASEALPGDYLPLAEVHALPEWSALRDEARAASAVFEVRGMMPEDREVE